MLPFPRINQYGNVAPVPTVSIKELTVSQLTAESIGLTYSNGEFYVMGSSRSGKFGDGTSGSTTYTGAWFQLNSLIESSTGNKSGVRLFSIAYNVTTVIMYDGSIYAAGNITSIIPGGLGYGFSATQYTFTDISAAFKDTSGNFLVNLNTVKKIVSFDNARLFVIDESNQLWGLGTSTGYVLGNNSTTGSQALYSVPDGDNCKNVYCSTSATIIQKYDGTTWQCGTWTRITGTTASSSGLLVPSGSTGTINYTVLTQFSTYNNISQIAGSQYNTYTLNLDGTMHFWGYNSWQVSSSNTQVIDVSPTSVGSAIHFNDSTGSGNILSVYSSGIYGMGQNSLGSIGLGNTSSSYGTWASARTGILNDPAQTIDYTKITNLCSMTSSSFFVYNNEIYTTGSANYSLGLATTGFWKVMSTPRSSLYNYPVGTPLSTFTNITTSSGSDSILNRYQHSAAAWGSKVLIHSGRLSTASFHDTNGDLQVYDTTTNTWSTIANTTGSTANRLYGGMTVSGDKAYIYSGYTVAASTPTTPSNVLYIVDLLTGTWSTGASPSTATVTVANSYNARMTTTSDGMIWAYGMGNSTTLLMYNPSTNTWTTKTSAPVANVNNTQMTTDGTYLYIAVDNYLYKYSPSANQWFQISYKTSATSANTCVNGYIYAQSGLNLWRMNISTGEWVVFSSAFTTSKTFAQMVACNGIVYQTGGSSPSTTDNFWSITQ